MDYFQYMNPHALTDKFDQKIYIHKIPTLEAKQMVIKNHEKEIKKDSNGMYFVYRFQTMARQVIYRILGEEIDHSNLKLAVQYGNLYFLRKHLADEMVLDPEEKKEVLEVAKKWQNMGVHRWIVLNL